MKPNSITMMIWTVMLLVCTLLVKVESGKKGKKCKVAKPTAEEEALANAINHFTIDVYHEVRKGAASENIFLGPISISTAMTMVLLGSSGKGAEQLKELLYIKSGTLGVAWGGDKVHEAYKSLNSKLYGNTDEYTFQGANKLYPDDHLEVEQKYIDDMLKFYLTQIQRLNFGNVGLATQIINDWIANKTNDMLKDVLQDGDITAETIFVLVNAIYFKGQWLNKFDPVETKPKPFYVDEAKGVVTEVDMMYNLSSFNYYDMSRKNIDAQLLELQYVGCKFSMVIILPNQKNGLDEVERRLTYADIKGALDGIEDRRDYYGGPREVRVFLPKLKYRKRYDMLTVLQKMGMKSGLDMSGISKDPRLSITSIIHEAAIEVNEEGTEAAAVTVIIAGRSGPPAPKLFNCDHPFIFLIMDRSANTILFIGRVTDPSGTVSPTGRTARENPVEETNPWAKFFKNTKGKLGKNSLKPDVGEMAKRFKLGKAKGKR